MEFHLLVPMAFPAANLLFALWYLPSAHSPSLCMNDAVCDGLGRRMSSVPRCLCTATSLKLLYGIQNLFSILTYGCSCMNPWVLFCKKQKEQKEHLEVRLWADLGNKLNHVSVFWLHD